MRSTPQRRAVLDAFDGGPTEHLSADEVFARAALSLPDLGRGTVYATLAEFTEIGLLASFGTPQPVRYETNTRPHGHFRCRVCLRLFDVEVNLGDLEPIERRGFRVERLDVSAEGTCEECDEYQTGLREGARAMTRSGPPVDPLESPGAAAIELDTPVGPLLLAATADGIVRVAFSDHADVAKLRTLAAAGRGSRKARGHLAQASTELRRYFGGEPVAPQAEIDWARVEGAAVVQATLDIPYGAKRSYSDLGVTEPARRFGWILGANPVAILTPCHRVTRGVEVPASYVGGIERRAWLEQHEREHATKL